MHIAGNIIPEDEIKRERYADFFDGFGFNVSE